MKRARHLLRLDESGLELFKWHDREALAQAAFANGEYIAFANGDHASFAAWLRTQDARVPLRAVVELSAEGFELEELPRVRGADRRALIARRLAASFPHLPFARAETVSAAPSSPNAHTEWMLFSGLSRISAIEPWMDILNAAGANIELLVPASRLAAHFGGPADKQQAREAALIVHFSRAGMRLTAVRGRQALFSRLVANVPAASVHTERAAIDARWIDELALTLDYLAGMRALALPTALPIRIHACAAELAAAEAALADPRFGSRIQFAPAPHATAASADTRLLHWLASAPLQLGWTATDAAHANGRHRLRVAAAAATVAVAVGSLASGTLNWRQSLAHEEAQREVRQQHEQLRRQLAALETGTGAQRAQAQRLLATLDAVDAVTPPPLSTNALFRWIAGALADFPQLRLKSLDWQLPADARAQPLAVEIGFATQPPGTNAGRQAPLGPELGAQVGERLLALGAEAPRTLASSATALRIRFELTPAHFAGGEQ